MNIKDIVPWKWGGLRRQEITPPGSLNEYMDSIHQEIDRMFGEMLGSSRPMFRGEFWSGMDLSPSIDQIEDDKMFQVMVELPGLDVNDVDVTLNEGVLTVRGEKKQEKEEEEKNFFRRERAYGAFRRSIAIPGEVDESKIEAAFDKGVLTIALPKTEEAKSKIRHIDVKAA